jgi:hypothetical protein
MIILVGSFLFLGFGRASTPISGVVTSNTVWTWESSPYVLTGDLTVNSGVTLTIEPGVIVDFGARTLRVDGALIAQGTSANKVLFLSNGYSNQKIELRGSGSIIDNVIISSVPVIISDSSPTISNSYITSNSAEPITVNGGAPTISNNVIKFSATADGIHVNSGSPTIIDNIIAGQGHYCGIYTQGTAYISNNKITNCWTGIHAVGQTNIQQNIIMNNVNDGIKSENSASFIERNALANNKCGIGGTGTIQYNTITGNEVGIWGPLSTAVITNNNIYSNFNATSGITQNVHLTETYDITVTNNWWGTTVASAISQTLWDYKNDPINLGNAIYQPYLTQPNPQAPSVPTGIAVPTSPPTPPPYSPTSSPSETPTYTPTEEPTQTPYQYTPNPEQTPIIVGTPDPIIGQSDTDLLGVIVILSAVIASVTIILLINRKFTRSKKATVN